MKTEVSLVRDPSGVTREYSGSAIQQFCILLEFLGVSRLATSVSRVGGLSAVGHTVEFFDGVPGGVEAMGSALSGRLAEVMVALGASSVKLVDMSGEDMESMKALWALNDGVSDRPVGRPDGFAPMGQPEEEER